jgi:hypothetical protein
MGSILELINRAAVSPSQKSVLRRTVVMGPQIVERKSARWKIGSIFPKKGIWRSDQRAMLKRGMEPILRFPTSPTSFQVLRLESMHATIELIRGRS